MEDREEFLLEAIKIFEDLKKCAVFYGSAIEIDQWLEGVDFEPCGGTFKERIDGLMKKINEQNNP